MKISTVVESCWDFYLLKSMCIKSSSQVQNRQVIDIFANKQNVGV